MKRRVTVRTQLTKLQFSTHSYVFLFFMFLLIFPVTACVSIHVSIIVCGIHRICIFRYDFRIFAKKSWFCTKNTRLMTPFMISKKMQKTIFRKCPTSESDIKNNTQYFSTIWKICNRIYPTMESYTCSFIFYCIVIDFSGSFWQDIRGCVK